MKLGNTIFDEYPLFLAPMEGVTDASFRYVCKEFGADMTYTEFVSADGLIRDAASTLAKLQIGDYERPIGIQIYGHLMDPMIEAARIVEQAKPELIDINFGCPVKKIAARGAGSGMMREPDKMVEMTRRIVDAVKIPVTVKTRLGWDDDNKIIVELAERLQDVGVSALTIHGRTRSQMYRGEADWTLIREVKRNPRMRIPIIGNGDVTTPEIAKTMFENTGVDAIMIGRASYGHPWLFKEIKHFLRTGEKLPDLTVVEKVMLAKHHLAKSVEIKGEKTGILEMRRHFSHYFKGLPNFKETRLKLLTTLDMDEINRMLDYVSETWGGRNSCNEHE